MRNCLRNPRPAKAVFKEFLGGKHHLIYRVNPAAGRKLLEDFNRVFNDACLTVKPRWEDQADCIRLMTYNNPERGRAAIMYNYSQDIAVVNLIIDMQDELPELLCRDWEFYRYTLEGRRVTPEHPTPWGVLQPEQITFPTVPEERGDVRETHERTVWGIFMFYLKGLFK
jgi:hypothetical protein